MRDHFKIGVVALLAGLSALAVFTAPEPAPEAAQADVDLYGRLTATDGTKIAVHRLSAGLGEVAAGNFSMATLKARLETGTTANTELDQIAAKYTGFGTTTAGEINKAKFLWQIERALILVETEDYSEAQFKTVLGITTP